MQAWVDAVTTLGARPGNPNAIHAGGRAAKRMLEDARQRLGDALGADRAEVIFTSGATESVALGIIGAASAAPDPRSIVVSGLEHPAVAEQRIRAERAGLAWEVMPTDPAGVAVLQPELPGRQTTLVSLCWVCSETGVVQPVGQLVSMARELGFLTHSDATQAVGNLEVDFHASGLDLMSLGGHKFGAPVGTGALLVGRGVPIRSDRPGGGQERQLRSGTQDVAGAVALSVAAEEVQRTIVARRREYQALRDRLLRGLPVGVTASTTADSVPSIVHLSIPTAHPEALLLQLDRAGIMASAGSACHAGVTRPSRVMLAMGRSERQALGVLRISFGPGTIAADVDAFLFALPQAIAAASNMDRFDEQKEGRA